MSLGSITTMSSSATNGSSPSPKNNTPVSGTTSSSQNAAASSMKNAFKTFAQKISTKLDNNNFLSWKQQVEGIIRIHKLHRHLVNLVIPPRYLSTADRASETENPAYLQWHQEDSLLFTWLLTTLSESVLPRVVKCIHAHEVWTVIDQFQRTQIYAKSRQLRYELRSMEKGDCTIAKYLGRIQQIVDILKLTGDPVSHRDQLKTIVDGLPPEYLLRSFSIVTNHVKSSSPKPCFSLMKRAWIDCHEWCLMIHSPSILRKVLFLKLKTRHLRSSPILHLDLMAIVVVVVVDSLEVVVVMVVGQKFSAISVLKLDMMLKSVTTGYRLRLLDLISGVIQSYHLNLHPIFRILGTQQVFHHKCHNNGCLLLNGVFLNLVS